MTHLTTFTMAQAKRDFEYGLLLEFGFERCVVLEGGWNVLLRGKVAHGPLVDARTKQPRVFRTCDAAVSAVEQVGFKADFFVSGRLY